jgi:hypothetical protein
MGRLRPRPRPTALLIGAVLLVVAGSACDAEPGSSVASSTAPTASGTVPASAPLSTTAPSVAMGPTAPASTSPPPTTTPTTTAPPATIAPATLGPTTLPPATLPPATAPPATPVPTAPPAPLTACTSVVHIGDSTSVGLISPNYIADPAQRIDAQYAAVGVTDFRPEISGARSIVERLPGQENADEVAQRERASGFHGCWVLALGTTDAANIAVGSHVSAAERIDRMMAVIGDEPVLWVDVTTRVANGAWSDPHMQAWNLELVAATLRYPNLHVYDWAAVVQDDWFQRDQIHYTSTGYAERSRLIAEALAAAYPS